MKALKVMMVVLAVGMLSVTAFGQSPGLDCPTALPVAVPSNTPGDTLAGGGGFGPLPDCVDEYGGDGGWAVGAQWYSVVGTGNTMTATLCTKELTNTDAAMVVICNDCANPICVGASEDFCGITSYNPEVSWCSEAGTTYYIGVGDNFTPQGDFHLDVTDDGTACDTATNCNLVCGDGIRQADEECDHADVGACEFGCRNDLVEGACICNPPPVPMLPAAGLVGLGVLLVTGGALVFGRKRK